MNTGHGAEYILVLSGFNLDLSCTSPVLSFTMSALWKTTTTWSDRIPKCSSSCYCISQSLVMKGKVLISTFLCFSRNTETDCEHTEFVNVTCSTNHQYKSSYTPFKFASITKVYDIQHFQSQIIYLDVGSVWFRSRSTGCHWVYLFWQSWIVYLFALLGFFFFFWDSSCFWRLVNWFMSLICNSSSLLWRWNTLSEP